MISERDNRIAFTGPDAVREFLGAYLPDAQSIKQAMGYLAIVVPIETIEVYKESNTVVTHSVRIERGTYRNHEAFFLLRDKEPDVQMPWADPAPRELELVVTILDGAGWTQDRKDYSFASAESFGRGMQEWVLPDWQIVLGLEDGNANL